MWLRASSIAARYTSHREIESGLGITSHGSDAVSYENPLRPLTWGDLWLSGMLSTHATTVQVGSRGPCSPGSAQYYGTSPVHNCQVEARSVGFAKLVPSSLSHRVPSFVHCF